MAAVANEQGRQSLATVGLRWFYAYVAVMTVGVLVSAGNYWAAQSTGVAANAAEATFRELLHMRESVENVRRAAREVMKPVNRLFLDTSAELDLDEMAELRADLLAAADTVETDVRGYRDAGKLDLGIAMVAANAAELEGAVASALASGAQPGLISSTRLALANHWFQQLVNELGRLDSRLHDVSYSLQAQIAESVASSERHKGFILGATILLLAGAGLYGLLLNREFRQELARREGLVRDLETSHQELEHKAIELRKMSWVAERTKNSIVVTDAGGATEWVNEGFSALTGYSLEEARGKNPVALLQGPHTDVATVDRIGEKLARRQPVDEEILNYAKDGRPHWVRLEIQPVRDSGGTVTHFVALTSDISAQKSIQQQLERARDTALAAASARAQFLANTSHEIRTPMNGVLGMTELLLRTDLNPKQRGHAETILRSGRHLLAIINDVLDFAKMEAGRFELDPVATDIGVLLADIAESVKVEARRKGLDFQLQIEPARPPRLRLDAARLRQIVLNLTSNAIKFTTTGGIAIRARWRTSAERSDCVDLHIAVIDTGTGIVAEMQRHVFEPFVQASRKVAVEVGGTGLGLPIAHQLARLMGGDLVMSSAVGEGSTFELRVRATLAPEEELDATAETPLAPLGLRVLAAEDYEINQQVIRGALEFLGCTVKIAADGQQAVDSYVATPDEFDVILMDCRMPRVDGFEATQQIRDWEAVTQRRPVPIIAVTAGALASERRQCEEVGMTAFLAKPIEIAELRAILVERVLMAASGSQGLTSDADRTETGAVAALQGASPQASAG